MKSSKLTLTSPNWAGLWIYEIGATPLLLSGAKLERGIGCMLVGQLYFCSLFYAHMPFGETFMGATLYAD